jgi:hypothetical protein
MFAAAHGVTALLDYRKGYPPVVNAATGAGGASAPAVATVGEEKVITAFNPSMGRGGQSEFECVIPVESCQPPNQISYEGDAARRLPQVPYLLTFVLLGMSQKLRRISKRPSH